MVSASSTRPSSPSGTPQLKSPATSIRWGNCPSPYGSPRVSLEVSRTAGGVPFIARSRSPIRFESTSASSSRPESRSEPAKVQKKEKKGLVASIKKALNKNTEDYWNSRELNLAYSGVFARP